MPVMKGLLAPQNTFLDTIATRFDGTRKCPVRLSFSDKSSLSEKKNWWFRLLTWTLPHLNLLCGHLSPLFLSGFKIQLIN